MCSNMLQSLEVGNFTYLIFNKCIFPKWGCFNFNEISTHDVDFDATSGNHTFIKSLNFLVSNCQLT